jgi:hypothetical protein
MVDMVQKMTERRFDHERLWILRLNAPASSFGNSGPEMNLGSIPTASEARTVPLLSIMSKPENCHRLTALTIHRETPGNCATLNCARRARRA